MPGAMPAEINVNIRLPVSIRFLYGNMRMWHLKMIFQYLIITKLFRRRKDDEKIPIIHTGYTIR